MDGSRLTRPDVLDRMRAIVDAAGDPCLSSRHLVEVLLQPDQPVTMQLAARVLVEASQHWQASPAACRLIMPLGESASLLQAPPASNPTASSELSALYLFNSAYLEHVVDDLEGYQGAMPDVVIDGNAIITVRFRSFRTPEARRNGWEFQNQLEFHVRSDLPVASH